MEVIPCKYQTLQQVEEIHGESLIITLIYIYLIPVFSFVLLLKTKAVGGGGAIKLCSLVDITEKQRTTNTKWSSAKNYV